MTRTDREHMRHMGDNDLVVTYNEAHGTRVAVQSAEQNGGVSPDLAEKYALDRQIVTQARAVGKERTIGAREDSHPYLPESMWASPKERARHKGDRLRSRRGN